MLNYLQPFKDELVFTKSVIGDTSALFVHCSGSTRMTSKKQSRAPFVIHPAMTDIAKRLLVNARIAAEELPPGYDNNEAMNILLTLFNAEDDLHHLKIAGMRLPGDPPVARVDRWVTALASIGLVDRSGEFISLSADGHDLVGRLLQRMYDGQSAFR